MGAPLLKRLESEKLLVRKRDSLDERRVVVTLSKTGYSLRKRAIDILARLAASVKGSETINLEKLRNDIQRLVSIIAKASEIDRKSGK